jgi:type IV secretion system pilin
MKIKKYLSIALKVSLVYILPSSVLATGNLGSFEGLGEFTNFEKGDSIAGEDGAAVVIERILSAVIGFLTILGGLWFLIQMLVAGLSWAGAGGDAQKVEEAKKKMTNGAIGLIIMVAAYSITYIIGMILGFDILNFAETLLGIKATG